MKNRIISLVLVLCTLLACVPVFLFTATADEGDGTFTTTFSLDDETTSPMYTPGVSFDGFRGNWTAGYTDRQGNYTEYSNFVAGGNEQSLDGGNCWMYTGLWLANKRIVLTDDTVTAGAKQHFFQEGFDHNYAASLVYTSPYEGKITIGFKSLTCYDAAGDHDPVHDFAEFFMGIFINGKMVWPTTEGTYAVDETNATKWASIKRPDTVNDPEAPTELQQFEATDRTGITNIDVTVGDEITFSFARKGCRYAYAEPTIQFAAGYQSIPSKLMQSFSPNSEDWPTFKNGKGLGDMKQTSDYWTIGEIGATDTAFVPYPQYYRNGSEVDACHAGEDYKLNGSVKLLSRTALLNGSVVFGTASDYYSAFECVVSATGKATLGYQNIQLVAYSGGNYVALNDNSTVKFAIFKNGVQVGTDVLATAGEDGVTVEFPSDVDVLKGDKIVVAVKKDSANVYAVAGQPMVSYTNLTSFMSKEAAGAYDLNIEDVNVVADRSGAISLVFNAYATRAVYLDAPTSVSVYVWGKDIAAEDRTPENAQVFSAAQNNSYAFEYRFSDLSPKEMADVIAVQAVVEVPGLADKITSNVVEKSFADYAYAAYEASDDVAYKDLMVALLNYGAYSQVYFNYNTATLANKDLPASMTAIDYDELYYAKFDGTIPAGGDKAKICNTEITSFCLAPNKTLDSIGILANIEVDPYEVENKMAIQWAWTEEGLLENSYQFTPDAPYYLIENIGVEDFSKVLYIRASVSYNRIRYYGYTFTYSVESYAARMVDSTEAGIADLVHAMMQFSKAYNAYNA